MKTIGKFFVSLFMTGTVSIAGRKAYTSVEMQDILGDSKFKSWSTNLLVFNPEKPRATSDDDLWIEVAIFGEGGNLSNGLPVSINGKTMWIRSSSASIFLPVAWLRDVKEGGQIGVTLPLRVTPKKFNQSAAVALNLTAKQTLRLDYMSEYFTRFENRVDLARLAKERGADAFLGSKMGIADYEEVRNAFAKEIRRAYARSIVVTNITIAMLTYEHRVTEVGNRMEQLYADTNIRDVYDIADTIHQYSRVEYTTRKIQQLKAANEWYTQTLLECAKHSKKDPTDLTMAVEDFLNRVLDDEGYHAERVPFAWENLVAFMK